MNASGIVEASTETPTSATRPPPKRRSSGRSAASPAASEPLRADQQAGTMTLSRAPAGSRGAPGSSRRTAPHRARRWSSRPRRRPGWRTDARPAAAARRAARGGEERRQSDAARRSATTTAGAVRLLCVPSSRARRRSRSRPSKQRRARGRPGARPHRIRSRAASASRREARRRRSGRLTKKIHDQCRFCRIRPPTTGPRIGASIAGIDDDAHHPPHAFGPGDLGHDHLPDGHDHAAADALQHAE